MSDLIDTILTSETGQRMVDSVVNIYDNAYVGLWLFQAMGNEYDRWWTTVDELKQQTQPETATWSLPYWEQRYGLPTDESLPITERRRLIVEKERNRGPFTPRRVTDLVKTMTGMSSRVVENAGPHTFHVYLAATTPADGALAKELARIKPAHMSFEIHYEQSVSSTIYVGMGMTYAYKFSIRQVN